MLSFVPWIALISSYNDDGSARTKGPYFIGRPYADITDDPTTVRKKDGIISHSSLVHLFL